MQTATTQAEGTEPSVAGAERSSTAEGVRSGPLTTRDEATTAGRFAPARWLRLLLGLWVFATGLALTLRADLGLSSWDVLHDAIRGLTPLTFGQAVIAISVVVVIGSFILGVRPGPGTLANMVLVGAFTDAIVKSELLNALPSASLQVRAAGLGAGIAAIALGTALSISARLGAGPRDSLMLAVAKGMHVTPGAARAGIEGSVVVAGALMGGTVGVGTIAFAMLIGPAINGAFRILGLQTRPPGPRHRGGTRSAWKKKESTEATSGEDVWGHCCSA